MASSSSSSQYTGSRIPRSLSVESRPKMLKDFLLDDSESSSQTRFRSFSLKARKLPTAREVNAPPSKLVRCRSKASSTAISAIYRASEIVVNVVKYLPFNSVRPPTSILPRSISRRFQSSKKNSSRRDQLYVPIKVKDILRWKSFRDLAEETPVLLDFSSPPEFQTTTTTTTTSSGTNSKKSSWCDSDFTAEDLQSWSGNYEEYAGENVIEEIKKKIPWTAVGGDDCIEPTRGTVLNEQRDFLFEEREQNSPVSVLDSPFREYEESLSSFSRSLANMQRRRFMLMRKVQEFERLAQLEPVNLEECFSVQENTAFREEEEETREATEKASQLLDYINGECSVESYESFDVNHLLLFDFFKHELINASTTPIREHEFESELLEVAKDWLKGQYEGVFEWEVESRRVAYLKDMEKGARWSKFEEEQEEMTLEMESQMMENLLDEVLLEFLD